MPEADERASPSFEEALAELEQVVQDLEDGELNLSESLARYETGVKRLRQCHALLQQAERKIELLTKIDSRGNAETEPFDDSATLEDAAPAPRRKKKKARQARQSNPPSDADPDVGLF